MFLQINHQFRYIFLNQKLSLSLVCFNRYKNADWIISSIWRTKPNDFILFSCSWSMHAIYRFIFLYGDFVYLLQKFPSFIHVWDHSSGVIRLEYIKKFDHCMRRIHVSLKYINELTRTKCTEKQSSTCHFRLC